MNGRIVVISPENDLRRSLEFALQAEDFHVSTRASVPTQAELVADAADCVVLDETAFEHDMLQLIRFCAMAPLVVLLADKPTTAMGSLVVEIVEKPLRGGAVANSVRRALRKTIRLDTK